MSNDKNAMEYIWDRIPKLKDGKSIKYVKGDLDYLYTHGFVDTRNHTLEAWKNAFKPFKHDDESFVLTKEQFLTLRAYRYTGPSDEVFDADKIQDGPWSDSDLQVLYERSIGQASNITSETFWAYINSLKGKEGFTDKNGNLLMNSSVKQGLDVLIRKYPSPRTLLEIEVRRIRKNRNQELSGNTKNRDKSGFSVGQTEKESKQEAFDKLGASRSTQAAASEVHSDVEEIDIKSLKRPSKTFKG